MEEKEVKLVLQDLEYTIEEQKIRLSLGSWHTKQE